ncbi:hypothetical protein J3459_011471 [Metarhizium acridum]|nr:hypothetical protein J3459_011471 [Metarhizium acridum]
MQLFAIQLAAIRGDRKASQCLAEMLRKDFFAKSTLRLACDRPGQPVVETFGRRERDLAIIKAVLMIQHGHILPNAHFEKFNVNIEGAGKLRVSSENDTVAAKCAKACLCNKFR